jgi:hypothetical protein
MISVNPKTWAPLPASTPIEAQKAAEERPADQVGSPGDGFAGGLTSIGGSVLNTLTDAATFAGAETDENGNLRAGVDLMGVGGFTAITAGPTALMALANRVDPLTGASSSYVDRLGTTAANNAIKVSPTLVSAVLGPAIADGVTMIAPNLVKKYRDTKDIKNAEEKKAAEKDNQYSKISRAVAGGVVVGLAAGAVFLLKPEIFKKFGAGVSNAIEGSTKFTVDGKLHKLTGMLDDTAIRNTMAAVGKPIASDAAVTIHKVVQGMAPGGVAIKDAVFSNRLLMAGAGGVGTMLLANKAAGEEDGDRQKLLWGLTAAAGAATVGATWGIGKLTQGSIAANGGTGGLLAKNELFMKPNIEWVKKFATTIAPITAVPAGTAASQYFNIFNDFDEITAARSPFRK